jgi:microsomal epoxide hydrolase
MTSTAPGDRMPTPFEVTVAPAAVADLRDRLRSRRRPPVTAGEGWEFGTPTDYLSRLLDHWTESYDWSATQDRLNSWPNFTARTSIGEIHFLHVVGESAGGRPLLLTHGWPGSITEFLDVIEPLAFPSRHGGSAGDAFDLVVPSLPGFGWSAPPSRPLTTREIAAGWKELMVDTLGYQRFYAQGGDWGSLVASWLGIDHAEHVRAIHINMMGLRPYAGPDAPDLSEAERAWVRASRIRLRKEAGYQVIQGTKPNTLSHGLADSPAGLAAWIVEKFHTWSTRDGDEVPFSYDRLLDNIATYWFTETAGSSTWMYTAARETGGMVCERGERVEVPTGFLASPHDLFTPPPREWVDRVYNCVDRVDRDTGGHFLAMERPEEFTSHVRRFFSALEAGTLGDHPGAAGIEVSA